MAKIRLRRSAPFTPYSRQHKRTLTYLLVGTMLFAAYYLYTERPIDPLAVAFDHHQAYMNDATHNLRAEQSYDWRTAPFINKIKSYIPLPSGQPRDLPRIQSKDFPETRAERKQRERRRNYVREEFKVVWESYRVLAWKQDELLPVSGGGTEAFGGWGATLVDSLDTLWIMGLKEQFHEALDAVATIDFGTTDLNAISVFETTIRYLGGFLSAYDLSQEPMLLEKAIQVGEMIYRAFDTANHMPLGSLDIEAAKVAERTEFENEYSLCFACLGSLTMEFTRLAQITSEPKYYDIVARVSLLLEREQSNTKLPGLWPTTFNPTTQLFNSSNRFSIGALADSTYEYFPKMHALLGGLDPIYESMYTTAATKIDQHLIFRPMVPNADHGENILVSGDASVWSTDVPNLDPQGQHLTCFIGGMFALAGRLFNLPAQVTLGAKLTNGCIHAYASMPSGIMPETFSMLPCADRASCPWNQTRWDEAVSGETRESVPGFIIQDARYLLRPEAIESVFVMYRATGNRVYLNHAWDMFVAIVRASRTRYANGQVKNVLRTSQDPRTTPTTTTAAATATSTDTTDAISDPNQASNIEDKMESFWTAETLKYFYLIFSRPDMISLDEWVFNTEAHPFRRPQAGKPDALPGSGG
ncbi:hypothetical protein IAQ61_002201 [Plenodomus lingam]|uniref:uncharacterized protein n=1 Tax=Leptosphaeria maculans TaxID=5022 RepID=UPI0033230BAA|nr:hypothetical protein IAQ61_002201 [Plenodomus lingam]